MQIAAMPAPNMAPALPNLSRDSKTKPSINGTNSVNTVGNLVNVPKPSKNGEERESFGEISNEDVEQARNALQGLGLVDDHSIIIQILPATGSNDSMPDDQSQLSGSSFKQQSFETKSMGSVTTFAMDEKESIRPDDSASVRAAEEDEPHLNLSRNPSFRREVEPQTYPQRTVMRNVAPGVTIAARRYPGILLANPPQFGDLPVEPITEAVIIQALPSMVTSEVQDLGQNHMPVLVATPDDKLLQALTSPKDRLPLLQLEEKLMAFVVQSRDDVLELPPQNSFNRLLTHKLADYYNLAHQVSEDNTSVRIFRTICCSLPASLADIARAIQVGTPRASNAAHVKIMRRAQLGRGFSAGNSTGASSSVASKATSENGGETNSEEGLQSPSEGTPNKDKSKPTREEREAQYKAARERIFGDFQESVTSESGSTGETSASMSRSSSSSGKKKQRKNKTPRDDTFEARSAFVASYTPAHMQSAYQQPYSEMQFPGAYSTPTSNYPPNMYGSNPVQPYSNFDPNLSYGGPISPGGGMGQTYAGSDGWQNMQQTQAYNFPQPPYQQQLQIPPHMNSQYQQTPQQTMPANWTPNQAQQSFVHGQQVPTNTAWPQYGQQNNMQNGMPYQYGQLPSQGYGHAAPTNPQTPVLPWIGYIGSRSSAVASTKHFVSLMISISVWHPLAPMKSTRVTVAGVRTVHRPTVPRSFISVDAVAVSSAAMTSSAT